MEGRWRLDERIADGAEVETWAGVDLNLERRVALQVIRSSELDDPEARRDFDRRVTLLAQVEHPNVMRIFDIVDREGDAISVCEWIDGVVLEDAMRDGLIGATAAACLGTQVAAGLGALHAQGLIHRNVSPLNLMVTPEGVVKVTGGGRMRNLFSDSTLTDRDLLLVKTGYVAPERMDGESRDPRVDVYATGVVMWEITTGRRAFDLLADNGPGVLRLPRASESAADMPAAFDDVVHTATEPDPSRRPADGLDLYGRLAPIVPSRPAEVLAALLG